LAISAIQLAFGSDLLAMPSFGRPRLKLTANWSNFVIGSLRPATFAAFLLCSTAVARFAEAGYVRDT
jgi:hypothetical protein